jgi:4-hydroxy-tetrahydrodipicolinate reductase
VGISAARGGEVVGEHTIYFFGESDRIEITHRAANRSVFANGALHLARRLVEKGAGFYQVRDLI